MTKKLLLKDGLRIGKTELGLLQNAALENDASVLDALGGTLPAVLTTRSSAGVLGPGLQVAAFDGNGTITIQAGTAIFSNGVSVTLDAQATAQVGLNVTGYKVIMTAVTTGLGLGSFNLAADRLTLTYVPASGSSLTAADLYSNSDYLRLSKGATVYGTYRISSVSTNTVVLTAIVSTAGGAVSDVSHAPSGKFYPGYPLAGQTTETVGRYVGTISIQNSSYTVGSTDILLATVTRGASGAATVTDARNPLVPNIDALLIDNSKVADNAAILESKLSLSTALLNAKAWAHQQNTDTHTTAQAFFVKGASGSGGVRVLTTEDIVTSGSSGGGGGGSSSVTAASVSPSTGSIAVAGTLQLTGTYNAPSGLSVTTSWASSDPTKATVSQTGLVTGVAAGSVTITYTATSTGNATYTAATRTATATITVGTGGGSILTALNTGVVNNALALQVGSTYQVNPTVTVPTGVTASPTYTYTSSDAAKATVSATGLITGVAAGTATVSIRAQQAGATVNSTTYTAGDLTATITVTVSNNLVLVPEPNFRLAFVKKTTAFGSIVTEGTAYWGIKASAGTPTDQTNTWRITLGGHDVVRNIAANALRDCILVDSANNVFKVTANDAATAVSGGSATPFAVTVAKATSTPATGDCRIRSQATGVGLFVYPRTASNTTEEVPLLSYSNANVTAMYQPLGGGAVAGSQYYFKLISQNAAATPTSVYVDTTTAWGTLDEAVTVNVASITATPTTSSVRFNWASPSNFNMDTMNYLCAQQINGFPGTPYYNLTGLETPTGTGKLATGSYEVVASAGDTVKLYVRVIDSAGNVLSTTPATGQATIANRTQTGAMSFEQTFAALTNASFSTSTLSGGVGDGTYSFVLSNTAKTVLDEFNVVAIELKFDNFAASSSDVGIKARVYPRGAPGNSIYTPFVYSTGGTPAPILHDVSFLSALGPRTVLSVALERTTPIVGETFAITGTVVVHYRFQSDIDANRA